MIESPKREEPQVNYGVGRAGDAVSTGSGLGPRAGSQRGVVDVTGSQFARWSTLPGQ